MSASVQALLGAGFLLVGGVRLAIDKRGFKGAIESGEYWAGGCVVLMATGLPALLVGLSRMA